MNTKLGLFIKCPHPEIIECLGIENADFAVVDMEHTPISQANLYPLILAANLHNLDLIVRIPENNESYFKWCLDLGIKCIQIPHIQNVYDVEKAIKFSNFYPLGERGLCRFVRDAKYSSLNKNEYIENSNSKIKLIFQIEGKEGVENIDLIIDKLPEKSVIFIGPYDLSQSLSIPGQIWDSRVVNKMQDVVNKCREKNIEIGTFTDTFDGIEFWTNFGINYIEYSSDLNVFMNGFNQVKSIMIQTMKKNIMKFGDNYQ